MKNIFFLWIGFFYDVLSYVNNKVNENIVQYKYNKVKVRILH